jgi:very-short-patch-repair endonuclease
MRRARSATYEEYGFDELEDEEEFGPEPEKEYHLDDNNTFTPIGFALFTVLGASAEAYVVGDRCDSPIETILAGRLLHELKTHCGGRNLALVPQFHLGRYRYDFAIRRKGEDRPLILIECDGREFHRTPEQKANDRDKDALAQLAGAELFRFKGHEIYYHTAACVSQIVEAVLNATDEGRA